jgi:hypothetical protein
VQDHTEARERFPDGGAVKAAPLAKQPNRSNTPKPTERENR